MPCFRNILILLRFNFMATEGATLFTKLTFRSSSHLFNHKSVIIFMVVGGRENRLVIVYILKSDFFLFIVGFIGI